MSRATSRANDMDTARDAASMAAVNACRLRAAALEVLRAAGSAGLTDHELGAAIQAAGYRIADGNTSSGRRRLELVDEGLVEQVFDAETGKPLRRATPSGATAAVWAAVEGRTHHRIPASSLIPTDVVRYRRDGDWLQVAAVRDVSTTAVASLRVDHVGWASWVLSPSAMVDVRYLAGPSC